jgi:2-polyprenyl-6-hydroxyphenyl methylase/3-demethylubiquinone-9 3-methyltransferase
MNAAEHDWWNPAGSFRTLHWINPVRFEYFSGKLPSLSDKKILDIGCGGGLLSERFARSGATVAGIDISAEAIGVAKEHAEKEGLSIDYRVASIEDIAPFEKKGERFDCVVASEVLEHTENLEDFIKNAAGVLKEGGLFFFSTINATFKAKLLLTFVAEDILRLIPKGTHNARKFIRPSRLAGILRANSIDVEEIKGLGVDFSGAFRLTADTSANYIGYGVKRE